MSEFMHFGKLEYWEDYYNANPAKDFEWFQNFNGIKDIILGTFDPQVNRSSFVILDNGCGSSEVLKSLYLAGCSNLTGLDVNQSVISHLKQRDAALSEWITCWLTRRGMRCKED